MAGGSVAIEVTETIEDVSEEFPPNLTGSDIYQDIIIDIDSIQAHGE